MAKQPSKQSIEAAYFARQAPLRAYRKCESLAACAAAAWSLAIQSAHIASSSASRERWALASDSRTRAARNAELSLIWRATAPLRPAMKSLQAFATKSIAVSASAVTTHAFAPQALTDDSQAATPRGTPNAQLGLNPKSS